MPPELRLYYQMRELGLPVWAGGIQDQPHIWLQMVGMIASTVKTFEALRKQQNADNAVK